MLQGTEYLYITVLLVPKQKFSVMTLEVCERLVYLKSVFKEMNSAGNMLGVQF